MGDGSPIGSGDEIFLGPFAGDAEAGAGAGIAEIGNDAAGFDAGFEAILARFKPYFAGPGADAAALRCARLENFAVFAQLCFPEIVFRFPGSEDGFTRWVELQRGRGFGELLIEAAGAVHDRAREPGDRSLVPLDR